MTKNPIQAWTMERHKEGSWGVVVQPSTTTTANVALFGIHEKNFFVKFWKKIPSIEIYRLKVSLPHFCSTSGFCYFANLQPKYSNFDNIAIHRFWQYFSYRFITFKSDLGTTTQRLLVPIARFNLWVFTYLQVLP